MPQTPRLIVLIGALGFLAVSWVGTVSPCLVHAADAEIVIEFDAAAFELPEGIAIDKRGNIFVTLAPLGEIQKITPDGTPSLFAILDPAPSGPGALGLAVDAPGNVYAALGSANPLTRGVWVVSRDGQSQARLSNTEQIILPNALAFDKVGNLYVTDTALGAVWRIPPGGQAEVWVEDALLESPNLPGCDAGANGIAYRKRELYVANSCQGLIVRIPVQKDGSPGTAQIVFNGLLNPLDPFFPFIVDGIALDVHGNIYAVNFALSQLVRISPDGSVIEILADAIDGVPLDEPASVAFGTGKGDRQSVFITNFPFLGIPPSDIGPSVVKVDVGVPGLPLP